MVDPATLKGLVPNLAATPSLVYFHENQFAYPLSEQQHDSIDPQMVNLYSVLAADKVLFNSEYNRQSFLQGCGDLLQQFPDAVPPKIVDILSQRSEVLAIVFTIE